MPLNRPLTGIAEHLISPGYIGVHSRFLGRHFYVKIAGYGREKTCRTLHHPGCPATWALPVPTTSATLVATAPSTAGPRAGARFYAPIVCIGCHSWRRPLCSTTVCALSSTSDVPTSYTLPRMFLRTRLMSCITTYHCWPIAF